MLVQMIAYTCNCPKLAFCTVSNSFCIYILAPLNYFVLQITNFPDFIIHLFHLAFTIFAMHMLDILASSYIISSSGFFPMWLFLSCAPSRPMHGLLYGIAPTRFPKCFNLVCWPDPYSNFGVCKCFWNVTPLLHMPYLKNWNLCFSYQSSAWTLQLLLLCLYTMHPQSHTQDLPSF